MGATCGYRLRKESSLEREAVRRRSNAVAVEPFLEPVAFGGTATRLGGDSGSEEEYGEQELEGLHLGAGLRRSRSTIFQF